MEGFLNFFIDVLKFGLPYSVLALGIFISYRILDFADLGAEGSYTLGGAVVAICLYHSLNPFLSLLISIVCGFLYSSLLLLPRLGLLQALHKDPIRHHCCSMKYIRQIHFPRRM